MSKGKGKGQSLSTAPQIHYLNVGGGKTMDLSVKDRLLLSSLLPTVSDIITLRVVQEVQEQLAFDSQEVETYNLRRDGVTMLWDDTAALSKSIAFSKAALGIILAALQQLNAQKQLTADHISLYEMFVEYVERPEEAAQ